MFTTDPTIVDLKIKERDLYKAIFSMNFHQVATPELGVDEARCYIFFFREGAKFSAYIVLYMPNSERRAYYTYSSNPFPEADLPMVVDDARAFGEDMGFFLDERSFASSSIAEKNQWIDEQPLFGYKTPEELELADALRRSAATAEPEAEQPPAAAVAVETNVKIAAAASATPLGQQTLPEAQSQPESIWPVAQPGPAQPVPATPPPVSTAPAYQPAPAQAEPATAVPVPMPPAPTPVPVEPVHQAAAAQAVSVPSPASITPVQPTPAPQVHQQAPAQPVRATPPVAPVDHQPAPAAAAVQTPPQRAEIEIEPQVEVEVEVDTHLQRQKSSAVPRSSTERTKPAGAAPKTARSSAGNPPEVDQRAAPKTAAPKPQVKKEMSAASGVVGRELEALARLMASF